MACEERPVTAEWTLPGEAESLRQVREHLRQTLGHLGADDLYVVLLAATELATNAIHHTASGKAGGKYQLAVAAEAGHVRVAVCDAGSRIAPQAGTAEDLASVIAERGRGLAILAQMGEVGWEAEAGGRRVWADLPLHGSEVAR